MPSGALGVILSFFFNFDIIWWFRILSVRLLGIFSPLIIPLILFTLWLIVTATSFSRGLFVWLLLIILHAAFDLHLSILLIQSCLRFIFLVFLFLFLLHLLCLFWLWFVLCRLCLCLAFCFSALAFAFLAAALGAFFLSSSCFAFDCFAALR